MDQVKWVIGSAFQAPWSHSSDRILCSNFLLWKCDMLANASPERDALYWLPGLRKMFLHKTFLKNNFLNVTKNNILFSLFYIGVCKTSDCSFFHLKLYMMTYFISFPLVEIYDAFFSWERRWDYRGSPLCRVLVLHFSSGYWLPLTRTRAIW